MRLLQTFFFSGKVAPLMGLATLTFSGLAAAPAHAQLFPFTSGTYSASSLANDGTQGTTFDTLSLSSVNSNVFLTAGTPTVAAINGITFTAGLSSANVYGPIPYTGSESFTFDGITKTLTFPYSVLSNTTDVLQFSTGTTTIFNLGAMGQVAVTPQPVQLTAANGPASSTLQASFLFTPAAVPEASSTVSFGLLLVLGAGAFAINAKRKATGTRA